MPTKALENHEHKYNFQHNQSTKHVGKISVSDNQPPRIKCLMDSIRTIMDRDKGLAQFWS